MLYRMVWYEKHESGDPRLAKRKVSEPIHSDFLSYDDICRLLDWRIEHGHAIGGHIEYKSDNGEWYLAE
jgi:hypothetical protein